MVSRKAPLRCRTLRRLPGISMTRSSAGRQPRSLTDKKPSFSEQLAKLQQERGRSLLPPEMPKPERALKSVPSVDDDLIPQIHDQSEDDIGIDNIISSIDILGAYRKWIGKEVDEST